MGKASKLAKGKKGNNLECYENHENESNHHHNDADADQGRPALNAQSLIHEWTFDNGYQDTIGSWNGSAAGSGVGIVTSNPQQGSGCLSLNGNSYIALGTQTMPSSFTITAWLWVSSGTPAPYIQTLLGNSAAGLNNNGFDFFVNSWNLSGGPDGMMHVQTGDGASGIDVSRRDTQFNQWGNIALTIIALNRIRIREFYYDGNLVRARHGDDRFWPDGELKRVRWAHLGMAILSLMARLMICASTMACWIKRK